MHWAVLLLTVGYLPPANVEPDFSRDLAPFLQQHCLSCHGQKRPKGGVQLTGAHSNADLIKDPKLWEQVAEEIRARRMPPVMKPQPTDAERDRVTSWITRVLAEYAKKAKPEDPGPRLVHRLNRLEYNSTVRDLLGVNSNPADKFPSDGGGGAGFDNNAATLYIPPILLERYLRAAEECTKTGDPKKLLVTRPATPAEESAAADKNLGSMLRRAFRRPTQPAEIARYRKLYDQARARKNASFESALFTAYQAILVSPHFLFRIERDPDGNQPAKINDFELASRLSYFLWASMPDEELFQLAEGRKLSEPAVLEKQVRRMLADPKSERFTDNFTEQWLGTRVLRTSHRPDANKFPEYTSELKEAMLREANLFFRHVILENESIDKLLDCNYTFLNETLAKNYGITNVKGSAFRKVELSDHRRGGILTMAAVLTHTSYAQRTSPVLRGKWLLEEVLGGPPPPPPPVVAVLPPEDRVVDGKTLRQRLEEHRKRAECAGCHAKIDPLGFGLENYDPIGRWRDKISGQPVDANGVLSTGEKYTGPVQLKQVLLKRKAEFARHLAEKMTSYAIGRGVEYFDGPSLNLLFERWQKSGLGATTLVLEITSSMPFQYRRAGVSLADR